MHKIKLNGKVYEVDFNEYQSKDSGKINGIEFNLDLEQRNDSQYHIIKDDKSYSVDILHIDYDAKEIKLKVNGQVYEGIVQNDLDILLKEMGVESKTKTIANELHAPMPGMVIAVNVQKGQEVKKGETL